MIITRPTDVAVLEFRAVCGALRDGPAVEMVVQNGSGGARGAGADLQGPSAGGFHPFLAKGFH
jgi:hypothetical protein